MAAFDSDAAAYIVGILVGAAAAIAALIVVGWCCYRKLGIANVEEDEELHALRREAFEEPRPADRDEPVDPQTAEVPEDATTESSGPNKLMTAALAAQVKAKATAQQRKQAWRM